MTNLDYLYNPNIAKTYREKNYLVDKKLGFQIIEQGTILSHKGANAKKLPFGGLGADVLGGIVDSKGNSVENTFVADTINKPYTPPRESIIHSSETVIYIGFFYPVWGHVITDDIRRLWFLKSEAFKDYKNCPLAYIEWNKCSLKNQPNFRQLLEILEVDLDKLRPITQPTQFEKIIIPDSCFVSGRYYTNDYCRTIDRIRDFAIKHKSSTNINKIYYFHGQRQFGEERLAEYFKSKGYEIIRPEKLTLDEQLNLLINCESLASPLGSTSHNSVFMRDNMEVIVLSREGGYSNGYQRMLSQINLANTIVIDSSLSVFYTRNGPFCYIISEPLRKFFGEKWNGYAEDDFKIFLQYAKDSISKGLVSHPNITNYCAPALKDFIVQLKLREDLIAAYNVPPHRLDEFQPSSGYQTHVHKKGWGFWQKENSISGSTKDKLDIQAVKINFPSHKVYYSVYYNAEEGWSKEVAAPDIAGTTGKQKSIYGIRIRLDEAGARKFDILYRVHKFDNTWTAWAKNGEVIYSHGVKLNAIQIKLEPKT